MELEINLYSILPVQKITMCFCLLFSDKEIILEGSYWDCSVCTYKNSPEAFKCRMCDVRKGTSTRSVLSDNALQSRLCDFPELNRCCLL